MSIFSERVIAEEVLFKNYTIYIIYTTTREISAIWLA